MKRWLIAIVGCSSPVESSEMRCSIGDPSAPAQLEIIHLDASYAKVDTIAGQMVPLIQPPQGGWAALLGARATNIDGCRVDLTTSFRDNASGPIMKVDRRPTLLSDTGDGWGITQLSMIGNLQFCPPLTATRDLHDEPYEITVALEDAYGQQASQSKVIVPVCPDPDDTGRCLCECAVDYVLGSACP